MLQNLLLRNLKVGSCISAGQKTLKNRERRPQIKKILQPKVDHKERLLRENVSNIITSMKMAKILLNDPNLPDNFPFKVRTIFKRQVWKMLQNLQLRNLKVGSCISGGWRSLEKTPYPD